MISQAMIIAFAVGVLGGFVPAVLLGQELSINFPSVFSKKDYYDEYDNDNEY